MFKKAEKKNAKLRIALCGPAGAGKTYSALAVASAMGGKIAFVDTEHGSASKYADIFDFDVVEPEKFDPRELIETIRAAEKAGYSHVVIDSLSHYWSGKGGELEMVDNAAKRSSSGNSFAAWKTVTPVHNELIEAIIGSKINVFVTMRTKTEWVIEKNEFGKNAPRKVGLAPIMRDGIEFEFDICGDIDQDNNFVVTKSRCPALSGLTINRPGRQMAEVLQKWLSMPKQPETPLPAIGNTPTDKMPAEVKAIAPTPTQKAQALVDKIEADRKLPAEFEPGDEPAEIIGEIKAADRPAQKGQEPGKIESQKSASEVAAEIKLIRTLAKAGGANSNDDITALVTGILGYQKSSTMMSDAERAQVIDALRCM